MSQVDRLYDLFLVNGNKLTLGQILDAKISSKYTNRISELEERLELKGMTIDCKQNHDRPTENVYTIIPLGQRTFA